MRLRIRSDRIEDRFIGGYKPMGCPCEETGSALALWLRFPPESEEIEFSIIIRRPIYFTRVICKTICTSNWCAVMIGKHAYYSRLVVAIHLLAIESPLVIAASRFFMSCPRSWKLTPEPALTPVAAAQTTCFSGTAQSPAAKAPSTVVS